MSFNKFQPHVVIIPEDRAISEIANGFLLDPDIRIRAVTIEDVAGGWIHVREIFEEKYAGVMARYPHLHVLLLMDFDNDSERRQQIRGQIGPEHLERVFILGISSESENLKAAMRLSFEKIGQALAADCRNKTNDYWNHELLRDNADEVVRLRTHVYNFLFRSD